jgi:4-amino-4-deoxy-L-arabinose transferase-like glycosyltransferase
MKPSILSDIRITNEQFWIAAIITARIFIQLYAVPHYGYFVDEFYYLACSRHPDFGYVDHPPLSIWLLWIVRYLFGESLWAIRMPAALAGAFTVFLSSRLAKALDGGPFATILTALVTAFVPVYLGINKFYSMNSFDLIFWTGNVLIIAKILKEDQQNDLRRWAGLGVLLGFGLLNKHSVLFLGFAFATGILLTRRRWFFLKGPYLATGIAFLIFSPNLVWEYMHGWPTLEFMQNATAYKNYFSPVDFIAGQFLEMHPLFAVIWISGLGALLFHHDFTEQRIFAFMYVALFSLFFVTGAKTYYLSPFYPILLAAGCVLFARMTGEGRIYRWIVVPFIIVGGFVLLPLSLPLLSPQKYIDYQAVLGIEPPRIEKMEGGKMPQHFAGMFGWQELRSSVVGVYRSLTPEERIATVILGANYGFAGALELERESSGLPAVGSGHNNYYLWGPPPTPDGVLPQVIITVGYEVERLTPLCRSVEIAAIARCEHCMVYRVQTPVLVCREPIIPLEQFWPRLKMFI